VLLGAQVPAQLGRADAQDRVEDVGLSRPVHVAELEAPDGVVVRGLGVDVGVLVVVVVGPGNCIYLFLNFMKQVLHRS
jgi:hypothetical protein